MIKVYIINSLDIKEEDKNILFPFEIEKINNIKNKEDKLLSLSSLLLVKAFTYKEDIKYTLFNKPYKINKPFFSISHSNPYSIICISSNNVGIDIENINRINSNLKNNLFSNNEKKLIQSDEDYIKLWTIKEACYKVKNSSLFNFKDEIILDNNRCHYLNNSYFYKSFKFENYYISIASFTDFDYEYNLISKEELYLKLNK